jgi:hypothetical protein
MKFFSPRSQPGDMKVFWRMLSRPKGRFWVIALLLAASTLHAQTAPVFTDSFTGTRLNLSRWDLFPQNGATISTGSPKEDRTMFRVPEHRFFLLGRPIQVIAGGSGSGGVQAFMQFASAESVQHAFQIVSGCGPADFRLRSPQSTQ